MIQVPEHLTKCVLLHYLGKSMHMSLHAWTFAVSLACNVTQKTIFLSVARQKHQADLFSKR